MDLVTLTSLARVTFQIFRRQDTVLNGIELASVRSIDLFVLTYWTTSFCNISASAFFCLSDFGGFLSAWSFSLSFFGGWNRTGREFSVSRSPLLRHLPSSPSSSRECFFTREECQSAYLKRKMDNQTNLDARPSTTKARQRRAYTCFHFFFAYHKQTISWFLLSSLNVYSLQVSIDFFFSSPEKKAEENSHRLPELFERRNGRSVGVRNKVIEREREKNV